MKIIALALLTLAASLGCAPPGESVGSTEAESRAASKGNPAIDAAREATAVLKGALAKDSVFDGRLGMEVATLRPLLTDDELLAYQRKYAELDPVMQSERAVGVAAYALRAELDKLMADPAEVMRGVKIRVLTANGSTLQQIVAYGPKQLYESYRLLAGTSEGDAAATFADRLLRKEPALKAVWSHHSEKDIVEQLGTPGLLRAFVRTFATLEASSKQSPVDEVKQTVGVSSTALSTTLNLMSALGDHEVKDLTSQLGKTTIPIGVAMSVWQLGRDANNAHWKAVLTDLLSLPGAAASTLEFAEAVNVVSASSRLFKAGESVGKLAGGLGVLMQTISLVSSLEDWNKSTGTKIAIIGNTVGAMSSLLALCGVASIGPIGAVVAVAAGIIGPMMDKAREDGRQNKDKEAVLIAIGWSPKHARAVARARGSFVRTFTGTLGMTRAETLAIIDRVPELAHGDVTDLAITTNGTMPLTLDGLVTFEHVFGAGSARTLLEAGPGRDADPTRRATRLEVVIAATDFRSLGTPVFRPSMTPGEYRGQLVEIVKGMRTRVGGEAAPALEAFSAYVAALP